MDTRMENVAKLYGNIKTAMASESGVKIDEIYSVSYVRGGVLFRRGEVADRNPMKYYIQDEWFAFTIAASGKVTWLNKDEDNRGGPFNPTNHKGAYNSYTGAYSRIAKAQYDLDRREKLETDILNKASKIKLNVSFDPAEQTVSMSAYEFKRLKMFRVKEI